MSSFISTRLLFLVILLSVFLLVDYALGHSIKETSAKIVLRDNHISVVIQVNTHVWYAGMPQALKDELSKNNIFLLKKQWQLYRQSIENKIVLIVGNNKQPLLLRAYPKHQLFESYAEKKDKHGAYATLLLETKPLPVKPKRVALKLPDEFGPALINFVQPQSQWVKQGGAGTFLVK